RRRRTGRHRHRGAGAARGHRPDPTGRWGRGVAPPAPLLRLQGALPADRLLLPPAVPRVRPRQRRASHAPYGSDRAPGAAHRRPPASYAPLTAGERGELPDGIRLAPGFRTDLALGDGPQAGALGLVPRATPTPAPAPAPEPAPEPGSAVAPRPAVVPAAPPG